jgi:hypothetical protein
MRSLWRFRAKWINGERLEQWWNEVEMERLVLCDLHLVHSCTQVPFELFEQFV